jgi:pimeloyl-ACP methyl ester carboxylesterase
VRDDAITLPDGRTLAYTDLGTDARGAPVAFYLHGAPTSRLDLASADAELAALGLRVLCPDRPGYGGSSPLPGRSMLDHATDVGALADRLGVADFVVVGLSSGGPYALACSAALGPRVARAAVVAGVTDFGWPDAWTDYDPDECEMMRQPDEEAARQWCEARFGRDGMGFLAGELPETEEAAFAELPDSGGMTASIVESFRQGVVGFAQDVWVQGRAWPFDAADIAAPVQVFHGDIDAVVPIAHAAHTSSLVTNAELVVWPGVAHVATVALVPQVIAGLVR